MRVVELTEDSLLETERFFYRDKPGLRMLTKSLVLMRVLEKLPLVPALSITDISLTGPGGA